MRTHRLKVTCNSEECAKFIEEEIAHDDFCDMTHWYCGLDGDGEDTPDTCIIYRGIIEPNVLYIDFYVPEKMTSTCSIWTDRYERLKETIPVSHPGWNVLKVELSELDSYKKIKSLEAEIEKIRVKQ